MTPRAAVPFKFSVVVASRGRPAWLKRCLLSLCQQDYPAYEVLVVAESETLAQIAQPAVKKVPYEEANLSAARNRGVAAAAGEICAFIDDDAVAEPLWLYRLSEAFAVTSADAVVGFVRGRNGISFQSRLALVDAEAETHQVATDREQPFVPTVPNGQAVKLVGTNMAIRRNVLRSVGGFDEIYRFYLEDSDLSRRLAQKGKRLAVAPLAEVHHGFAASPRRTRQRAPRDLFDIGRSTSYFLGRHFGSTDDEFWVRLERRERKRLSRHLVAGTCEPRDMIRCLESLLTGWRDGLKATFKEPTHNIAEPEAPFANLGDSRRSHEILSSYWFHKRRNLLRTAEKFTKADQQATVLSFSLTTIRHHVSYADAGFWLQTGGLFGPSERDGPAFQWCRFADRVEREIRRVAKSRGIGECDTRKWWDTYAVERLDF
ncbi:MAG: glycosyltransferase [Pseudomonadota bacterium]